MQQRRRLLGTQDRRQFMTLFGFGALAAALTPSAVAQQVPSPSALDMPPPPPSFVERMVRLAHRPVIAARNILGRSNRMPAIVVMDDEGEYIYGRLDYENGPYSMPTRGVSRSEDRPEWIAAQHQFTASTTKVVALLAAIDWIKEEAANGPHPDDADPVDTLLHPGLEQYKRVLGRKVSLTPRINTGGIMFHDEIDPRGSINELSVDEVLRFSQLFSTNDLLSYLSRHMSRDGGKSLNERMRGVCERLNMTDSTFPTVHGMPGSDRSGRVDCRSTGAEMIHVVRVLDVLNPEFAPYVQQVVYYPENAQLVSLRSDGMRPRTQYIEGPARSGHVVLATNRIDEPLLDAAGRDLNAAYDPSAAQQQPPAADENAPEGSSLDAGDAPAEPDVPDAPEQDETPIGGYRGVRILKSGQIGAEKGMTGRGRRRRLAWLPKSRRTSWRTTVGMASRIIGGVERKIYFFTSSDSAGQRQNAIREALREGFDRLETRARLARVDPPRNGSVAAAPAL